MTSEIFNALMLVALPVFIFSTLVLIWLNHRGHSTFEASFQGANSQTQDKDSENDKNNRTFLHRKWVQFGGGFYGMLALLTYLVVEWNEITSLVIEFKGFEGDLLNLLINFAIQFIIESISNLVTAFTWPVYWAGKIDGVGIGYLFMAAYLGYYLSMKSTPFIYAQIFTLNADGDNTLQ